MPKRPHKPRSSHVIDRLILLVAFVQPLSTIPQIITIYAHQDAHSISFITWGLFILFDIMWLWYGIAEKQLPVLVSAIMFTLMEGAVMLGAILYGGTW